MLCVVFLDDNKYHLTNCVLHWVLRYDQREEGMMGLLRNKHKKGEKHIPTIDGKTDGKRPF